MEPQSEEHSPGEAPARSKPKRMSSIKKIGKLLGITSSKKKSKDNSLSEEQHEEDDAAYDLPTTISTLSPPKPADTGKGFPSPLAKILAPREPEPDKTDDSRSRYSFSKPKSFYRTSDNISRKSSTTPNLDDIIVEDSPAEPPKPETPSTFPLAISTDIDDAPKPTFMKPPLIFSEEDFAGDIATKSLRAALSQTHVIYYCTCLYRMSDC
jgi:hypothetical protein